MFDISLCIFWACCECSEYSLNHEVDPMLSRTSHGKLFSVNEEEQREALKGFYERWATIRHLNLHLHLHLHLHLQTMNGSISAHL